MFKKILSTGLIVLFVLSMIASSAYCDDALKKLGRGLANCVTFPIEIIEQVKRVNLSDGPTAAYTYGLLKGVSIHTWFVFFFLLPVVVIYVKIIPNIIGK
ncbi:MAG: hypothetical protein NTZ95_02675 [Candidatus Omnitrophica bacterium]|nr:hypothetical protein [Candidatus Omnitrophota bacterium]